MLMASQADESDGGTRKGRSEVDNDSVNYALESNKMYIEATNYVNGSFTESLGQTFNVSNPSTGGSVGTARDTQEDEVYLAVEYARQAQRTWAALPGVMRGEYLHRIADGLRRNRSQLVDIVAAEQGKPKDLAGDEADSAASYFDYMAEWARRIEGEIIPSDDPAETIFLNHKPIGVVAAIIPWNFPLFLIARKVAPAILTGNTVVLKSSELTPLNAFLVSRIIDESGLPPGVVNIISGRGESTGKYLSKCPDIDLITFTGSVPTGKSIMAEASRNLTRVNLELGGKAPAIVLKDADLDLAARAIWESRIINSGQVCNCTEKVLVEDDVHDALVERLERFFLETTVGDVSSGTFDMGPLITQASVQRVHDRISDAQANGAELIAGDQVSPGASGYFMAPSLLLNAKPGMDVMDKETFAPVLPVQRVSSLEDAVREANNSNYGLTSSVFTQNLDAATYACRNLEYGETYVNRENFEAIQGFHAGRKSSGMGGADGKHGLMEFMETHVTYLRSSLD